MTAAARMRMPGLLAAGAAILILVAAALCVTRVPGGSHGLAGRQEGGAGELLQPGLHLHVPFQPIHLIPQGGRRYSGILRSTSTEGAAISQPFEAEVDLGRASPAVLGALWSALSSGRSLEAAVSDLLAEAIGRAGASGASGEGAPQRGPALADLGLLEGALTLGRTRPVAAGAHPLLSAYRGPPRPLLVIGIDSADWDLMEPLMKDGRLPVLKGLRDGGAWGTLRSMTPTLSPILWTTIATGRPPEEHGVIDFLMTDPATGAEVPISRSFRKVKALWNIATDFDLSSLTVGWWATWPAERVLGQMVTDRVAYTLFDVPVGQDEAGATWPADLAGRIASLRVTDEEVSLEELREVCPVPAAVFERSRGALGTAEGYKDPVSHLIKVLSGTATYQRIALELLEKEKPALALVYFEGLDEVNHRFAHFAPPAMRMVRGSPPELAEAYGGAVEGFYELQDRLIGQLVKRAGPDVNVLVVSDHGFANGDERPVDAPPDIEGQPGRWHTLDGVIIAAGPSIRPGRLAQPAHLLDIAPTILALLGLPRAQDMPGRSLAEILLDEPAPAGGAVEVASYDEIGEPLCAAASASSGVDREMIARLAALGYIDAPEVSASAGAGTPTYHVNAGHIYLQKGEYGKAREEFARARELAPRFDQPLLGLAQVALMSKRPAEAIPLLEEALLLPGEGRSALFTRAARVYVSAGLAREGLAFLGGLRLEGTAEAHRLTAAAMLEESLGDVQGAVRDYEAALRLDPSVVRALSGAYGLLKRRGELDRLARLLEGSLQAEPRRVAVRAANWLALTREAQGRREEARGILMEALGKEPVDVMTLTNLGSMFLRDDKVAEAMPHLLKAYELRPKSLEVLVNLIVASGKQGDLAAARRYYDGAAFLDRPSARRPLYNAMAYACYLNADPAGAKEFVERSLALDPNQPDVVRLRQQIGSGSKP